MSRNIFDPQEPANEPKPTESNTGTSSTEEDEEAQLYYKRLEETGKLVDVDDTTDLATLPPHVTHIRRRDGTIERIGYS